MEKLKIESIHNHCVNLNLLSDKVLSFKGTDKEQEILEDGTLLNQVFYANKIEGEINDEVLKEFCNKVNLMAEKGFIEKFFLMPISIMHLPNIHNIVEENSKYEGLGFKEAVQFFEEATEQKLNNIKEIELSNRYLLLFYSYSRFTKDELNEKVKHFHLANVDNWSNKNEN